MTRRPPAIAQGAMTPQVLDAWRKARDLFFTPQPAKDYLATVFGDSK